MKTKLLLILLSIGFMYSSFSQNTSKETWNRILQKANVEWNTIYNKCPHFPKGQLSDKDFTQAVSEWSTKYASELEGFYSIREIKKINPSPYYLGLPLVEKSKYNNSFIQWVKESKISDRKIMELAPHFPDMTLEKENFDFQFHKWKNLYGHEYENIINAEELVALNPYYKKHIDIYQIPHFIGPLESKEKPIKTEFKTKEEELAFELKLMNWYFVFEPQNFKRVYGFFPEFPDFFNVEKYKQAIVLKIEETEKQKQSGAVETN